MNAIFRDLEKECGESFSPELYQEIKSRASQIMSEHVETIGNNIFAQKQRQITPAEVPQNGVVVYGHKPSLPVLRINAPSQETNRASVSMLSRYPIDATRAVEKPYTFTDIRPTISHLLSLLQNALLYTFKTIFSTIQENVLTDEFEQDERHC